MKETLTLTFQYLNVPKLDSQLQINRSCMRTCGGAFWESPLWRTGGEWLMKKMLTLTFQNLNVPKLDSQLQTDRSCVHLVHFDTLMLSSTRSDRDRLPSPLCCMSMGEYGWWKKCWRYPLRGSIVPNKAEFSTSNTWSTCSTMASYFLMFHELLLKLCVCCPPLPWENG